MMTNDTITPRVYCGTYARYNSGSLFGAWLDLDDYSDSDEFHAACRQLHAGEHDPELMFQDWEGIPSQFVGECWLSPEFWAWRELVEGSHLDTEVFEAAAELDIPAEEVEDCYIGEFDSAEELAEDHVEQTGMLDNLPADLVRYFDYQSFGRDMVLAGDVVNEGRCWFWSR